MTLQAAHQLAYEYLASKPECENFLPTLIGEAQPKTGHAELSQQSSSDAVIPIENIRGGVSKSTRRLVEAVLENHTAFDWWNAYTLDDPAGKDFVERTAGCLLTGTAAPFSAKAGCAGFFYLQQNVEYAAHAHEPEEIYVVLSGKARFWDTDMGWREAGAGEIVHMPSMIWHGMETREEPILILWSWIGENLGKKPIFRDNSGALPN